MQVVSDWVRLGQVVRDARRERAWSQAVLAGRADVSRAWLAKMESGHRRAEVEQVFRVLHALGLAIYVGERRQPAGEAAVLEALAAQGRRQ